MNAKHILERVDHTLLTQGATWEEIKLILELENPRSPFWEKMKTIISSKEKRGWDL